MVTIYDKRDMYFLVAGDGGGGGARCGWGVCEEKKVPALEVVVMCGIAFNIKMAII